MVRKSSADKALRTVNMCVIWLALVHSTHPHRWTCRPVQSSSVKSDLCKLAFHWHTNKMALDYLVSYLAQKTPPFWWFLRASLDSLQCHRQVDRPMISVNTANWPFANAVSHEGSTIIISQLCEEQWGFKQKHFKKSVLSEIRRFFVIWPQSENGSPTDRRLTDSKSHGRFE